MNKEGIPTFFVLILSAQSKNFVTFSVVDMEAEEKDSEEEKKKCVHISKETCNLTSRAQCQWLKKRNCFPFRL